MYQNSLKTIGLSLLMCLVSIQMIAQDEGCTTGNCENGKGRYVYDNGDKYIGEFLNGEAHGRGAYYFLDGSFYKGQFKHNVREGYGTFTWLNGESYIGEYKNNQRHGAGTYRYADGTEDEGSWVDGVFQREEEPIIAEEPADTIKEVTADPFSEAAASINVHNLKGSVFPRLVEIQPEQKRKALVIGNSNYTQNPLKNPVNDAVAFAEELQRSGFEVTVYTNVSQKEMKIAVRNFGHDLKDSGGIGLFYYAGHGLQADGRNFLVPVDAEIYKVQDIEFECMDLGRVLVELEYAANSMNILILDACRDNPYKDELEKSKYQSYNGLAAIGMAPYNSFIAFSTSPGSVALDGEGENGLYTQELLQSMRNQDRSLEEVFKYVRRNVRRFSKGKQIPWETSSVEDDFYFKK